MLRSTPDGGLRSENAGIARAVASVRTIITDRLVDAQVIRNAHANDVSHHRPIPPDAVAFPESNEEVAAVVRICAEHRCPIIPFGTGTAVEGGVVASRGGICVDLSRMNRILEVNPIDEYAHVQAGVTRKQLNAYLHEHFPGLHFAIDPGADASLGGMAATRASGSAAVKYGTMRENVLGLTAVLADGQIVHTGSRARKSAAGYDLTHLFVGSEGTLCIISEVLLRLARLPEAISAAVCDFPDIDSAVGAVIAVLSESIAMARIELLDEVQMGAVNQYSGLNYKVAPTLFLEFHGSARDVAEQAQRVGEILVEHGGGEFQWATRPEERNRLWQARHDALYAAMALRPGGVAYITDVCVPISQLANCILQTKQDLRKTSIPGPLFGHVGDGNYHVVFVIDPNSPAELDEVKELSRRMIDHALQAGGTCTGEHGIGMGKLDALEQEHGNAVDAMRAIKRALDPHNIMNPGKVLR